MMDELVNGPAVGMKPLYFGIPGLLKKLDATRSAAKRAMDQQKLGDAETNKRVRFDASEFQSIVEKALPEQARSVLLGIAELVKNEKMMFKSMTESDVAHMSALSSFIIPKESDKPKKANKKISKKMPDAIEDNIDK